MERILSLLCALWFCILCMTSNVSVGCIDEERKALVSFRKSLYDEANLIPDWKGHNCCKWVGVGCSKNTGRIVKLNILEGYQFDECVLFSNYIDHSLTTLKYLQHLDVSNICFNSTPIPQFIGALTHLRYLSLRNCDLVGTIPPNFGNLTNLRRLELGLNYGLRFDSLWWLSSLSGLQHLDLSFVNLTYAVDRPPISNKLSALSKTNLSSITSLGLDGNVFSGASILDWFLVNLGNSLVHLILANCDLRGPISCATGNLPTLNQTLNTTYKLKDLDLSGNQLSGSVPDWIGQLRSLENLYLDNNLLNGSIPSSLGQLGELVSIHLSSNSLQGVISDAHFANLTKLKWLDLNSNRLLFNLSPTWLPPFQLTNLYLRSCGLGPRFPLWLQMQEDISSIDISNARISDLMPDWFWHISSRASDINISHNQIGGELSMSLKFLSAESIDLSYNLFTGQLPRLNSSLSKLYASDNLFLGDLQPVLNEALGSLVIVILSRNRLTGKIPFSICKLKDIQILDLSYNSLSGEIPNCPTYAGNNTRFISFASNNLSGSIPKWIGNLPSLMLLRFSNNSFHGEVPSLRNCTKLILLDLGENKLTGYIPPWIGKSLPMLTVLRLRSNMLTGNIPSKLSNLTSLQILDLSHNDLSGKIPRSFNNFTAMSTSDKRQKQLSYEFNGGSTVDYSGNYIDDVTDLDNSDGFFQNLVVVMEGRYLEYTTTLRLVKLLDLSCNKLSGEIPLELMDLSELLSLNLSGNQLTGKIPDKIGNMAGLETLDLSRNKISGEIPWSLTLLNSLSNLDVSYNNLSGAIPSGSQLQTLTNVSVYEGNPGLCGFPLPKKCWGGEPSAVPKPEDNNDHHHDMFEFYLSISLGFLVGLWSVYGAFLFKGSWRIAFFRFIDVIANKNSVGMRVLFFR